MITTEVRFSYLTVFESKPNPSGVLKYSTAILVPKEDKEGVKRMQDGINKAVQRGIDTNKFTKAQVPGLRLPLRDGTKEHAAGTRGNEYNECFFVNASSNTAPGVVKAQKGGAPVPLLDQEEFYSGCYGHADINFFPYSQAGNRGIGVGLNNLLLTKTGDRLDGKKSAGNVFAAFTGVGVEADETKGEDDLFGTGNLE